MPRYLFKASYTHQGVQGLMAAGAASRVKILEEVAANVGGRVESFDFAFGDTDVFVICELPSNQAAAAVSLAVGAGGGAAVETVPLLSPAEVDEARGINTGYRPPGS